MPDAPPPAACYVLADFFMDVIAGEAHRAGGDTAGGGGSPASHFKSNKSAYKIQKFKENKLKYGKIKERIYGNYRN